MRYFRYLLHLAGIILISGNTSANDWDFRQVKWGMSTYDVKDREFVLGQKWKLLKQDNGDYSIALIYEGKLFDQYCLLIYQFKNNYGLFSASYSFADLTGENTLTPHLLQIT